MLPDRRIIKDIVSDFSSRVAASEDAKDDEVKTLLTQVGASVASWTANGGKVPEMTPVLKAANALLDRLYALNDNGLPQPYRDNASEVLMLLDAAEEQGFDIKDENPISVRP
jgi:hypothetical protein